MYYNGCKYARSKTVRKFRLSVKTEESEIEERMHVLATLLSPLYMNLAPKSFDNQCQFEKEASDCRLGFKPGRPFSGYFMYYVPFNDLFFLNYISFRKLYKMIKLLTLFNKNYNIHKKLLRDGYFVR